MVAHWRDRRDLLCTHHDCLPGITGFGSVRAGFSKAPHLSRSCRSASNAKTYLAQSRKESKEELKLAFEALLPLRLCSLCVFARNLHTDSRLDRSLIVQKTSIKRSHVAEQPLLSHWQTHARGVKDDLASEAFDSRSCGVSVRELHARASQFKHSERAAYAVSIGVTFASEVTCGRGSSHLAAARCVNDR